jgi:WD40 repeat protein
VYSNRTMLGAIDLLTSEEKTLLPGPLEIFAGFAWSPDAKQLALVVRPAGEGPRQLWLLDPSDPRRPESPRLKDDLDGSISYSPDGQQLLFSKGGELYTLAIAGNAQPQKIDRQQGKNWNPAYSPDGTAIAFASSRQAPQSAPAMAAATGREKILQELRRHEKRSIVWSVDFTPDGRQVVIGGANNTGVQLWDVATGKTRDLGGKGMLVQMFPDGRRFATSWTFRNAHIIDMESGDVLREIDNVSRIWAFGVSQDGRKLLTGGLDKVIRIWDAETGETLLSMEAQPDYILRAAFSPDGQEVITVGHDHSLRTFETATGKQRLNVEHPAAIWGLAVSADGRHILTGTGGSLTGSLTGLNLAEGDDNVLRMWDRESGKLVREMKGHTGGVFCIDVSPDGQLAASGSSDGTLRLWDLSTGEERSKMGPGKGIVACVRFSPDSQLIVAGGGVARIQGERIEFPTEQIRVYKILDAEQETAGKRAD